MEVQKEVQKLKNNKEQKSKPEVTVVTVGNLWTRRTNKEWIAMYEEEMKK